MARVIHKDLETALYKNACEAFAGVTEGKMAGWNDAPGRTKAEVVAKLREAAAAARSAGGS